MKHTLVVLAFAGALLAQPPPARPKPIIDNDRVRVWQGTSVMGAPFTDIVSIYGTRGTIEAEFTPKAASGSTGELVIALAQPGLSTPRATTLMIELKDRTVAPIPNPTGLPLAFPREAIKQLLDNARITVWDYTWTLNQPTPMHFHDKDVVVMFLEDGDLQSTTVAGAKTVNEYKPGTVRFNPRDRAHNEELIRGRQRAIIVELK